MLQWKIHDAHKIHTIATAQTLGIFPKKKKRTRVKMLVKYYSEN